MLAFELSWLLDKAITAAKDASRNAEMTVQRPAAVYRRRAPERLRGAPDREIASLRISAREIGRADTRCDPVCQCRCARRSPSDAVRLGVEDRGRSSPPQATT